MHSQLSDNDALPGIMFTCIGRRVSLLRSFQTAATKLGLGYRFIGTDMTCQSSALQLCDRKFVVEKVTHDDYISQLLVIAERNRVKMLIPTVDLDLKILSENKSRFEAIGCRVLVSNPEVIDICQDKIKTYEFLSSRELPCPRTMTIEQALKADSLPWPCFLKPRDGYASRGSAVVANRPELEFFSDKVPEAIVQHLIEGTEYTCDVYVDFDMNVRCVVPRERLEIRSGEVSKSRTVKNRQMMDQAGRVVKALGAGPGVITIQLFLLGDGRISFIEVNPRFGGGVPLSIQAGADFPTFLLQELNGHKPDMKFDGFEDNVVMLRYDAEVWLKGDGHV